MARWGVGSRQPLASLTASGGLPGLSGIAFSPVRGTSLAAGSGDGVAVWSLSNRAVNVYRVPDAGHGATVPGNGTVVSVAYTPDGKSVAAAAYAGGIYLLNPADGQWAGRSFTDPGHPTQVAVSPDGTTLAVADSAGHVYLWSQSAGERLVTTGAQKRSPQTVAFSPDGKTLAIAAPGGAELYDVATGRFAAPRGVGLPPAVAVAFSADGGTLAVAGVTGDIVLTDLATRQALPLRTGVPGIDGVALQPGRHDPGRLRRRAHDRPLLRQVRGIVTGSGRDGRPWRTRHRHRHDRQVGFVNRPPRQRRHRIFHGQTLRTSRRAWQHVSSLVPAATAWYERKRRRSPSP